jgi:hypothetical protein
MAKKQFKIGECAVGGIIAVETTSTHITINALDYYSKKPVVAELKLPVTMNDILHSLECYIWDLTTSYHTDKIMTWIKTKI